MKRVILLIAVCSFARAVSGCSLAVHEWQLQFQVRLSPQTTVLPLSELDVARDPIAGGSVSCVYWVTRHDPLSYYITQFMFLFSGGNSHTPWKAEPSSSSVVQAILNAPATDPAPVILGSDHHSLRIALFSDQNSQFRCHQLILYESRRIRAIHYQPQQPWAREVDGRSWLSITFFEYPVPGNILSISASPIGGQPVELFTDPELVEALVAGKRLKLRPTSAYTPLSKEIPEIPE
ncbi:MAG TPA: hypothetical protein PKM25_12065 [Candidatus Ozemobacteraceae bacterium]|nr:hypothetical protein [Candidatus Ozemobacteraceae bacterium]